MTAPLSGIKVVEMAGLAPGPFAGMVLCDFGAEVVRVDRAGGSGMSADPLCRGKKSVALDLKSEDGIRKVKQLVTHADVLIEPFRPGVMERLGLGPDILCELNPRLIYARMTGFGQGGDNSVELAAGHDINYLALSGVLSTLKVDGKPVPPVNVLGDFAGGGMMCAFGILMALLEREKSNRGQVVDTAMVDGAAYLSTFVLKMYELNGWKIQTAGKHLLDGGAPFYGTYECKCGGWFSVGALEPQFYKLFIAKLGVKPATGQFNAKGYPAMKQLFTETFLTKTRDEWTTVFHGVDACAFPVLTPQEAAKEPHNVKRGTFMGKKSIPDPAPAPKLSRTPGINSIRPMPKIGQHTDEIFSKL
eukprot:TRINITY_DN2525_c2_g1_i1.p1 TRINITY_DN2525_c2_g1~~TRINITY_DN2525_c2_g1_i1.p1  ORF type:complete len:360 (+),score=38.15 TRINITY_DN2525_c2_g1_i1:53-1132(+)